MLISKWFVFDVVNEGFVINDRLAFMRMLGLLNEHLVCLMKLDSARNNIQIVVIVD